MTPVFVDSNVLIDVIGDDTEWAAWSADQLERLIDRTRLVINAVVYSEIAPQYQRIEDLEAALPTARFALGPIPKEAAFLAG